MSWRRRSRERASPSNSDAHSCSRSRILRLMRALHLPIKSSSSHRKSYSYLGFRGQKKGGLAEMRVSSSHRQWIETVGERQWAQARTRSLLDPPRTSCRIRARVWACPSARWCGCICVCNRVKVRVRGLEREKRSA
jgi:hypothetical protein